MNKFLTAAVAAFLLTAPAYATPPVDTGTTCNGNGSCASTTNNNTTNNTTNQGGAGGRGGEGGTGIGIGVGLGGKGGDSEATAKIERGAVDIENTNKQKQQQQQQQQQKQKASARSSSSSYSESEVENSGNSDVAINYQRNTPPAYAPALVASSETCVQSQTVGASSPVFGFSLGITHDEDGCNMRRNAGMLFALGQRAAAVELLCLDDDIRAAMKNAGTFCAADQPAGAPVASLDETAITQSARVASVMDPIDDDK